MSVTALSWEPPRVRVDELGRWSAGLVFVLAAHILFALFVLSKREAVETAAEPPAAVLIDLAASSPSDAAPSELPPAPDQIAAPDAPIAPTEDEAEEPLAELDPLAEAVAEPTHQAIAEPLPDLLNRDALRPTVDVAAEEPVAEAAAARLPEPLESEELSTLAEAVAEPAPQAVAEPLPDLPPTDDFKPLTETVTEPMVQAIAEPLPELPGTDDLAPAAEAAVEPAAEAAAAAAPEALQRIDLQSGATAVAANATPVQPNIVEADPTALASIAAIDDPTLPPLPRPRPDIVPELPPVETPAPRRTRAATTETETPPRETSRRRAAARPPAPETTAPAAQPAPAEAASAPQAGAAASAPSISPDRWRSAVYRHLERYKRYPRAAESRGISGTVRVRFAIDRNGNILSHRITASSGHAELDEAVSALIGRASPVPAPPPELYRSGMAIEVPIRFSRR